MMSTSHNIHNLLEELKTLLGPKGWRMPADAPGYFIDARDRFRGNGSLIVLPSSTEQVSQVVQSCGRAKIGIVPFGGGTGGVAGHIEILDRPSITLSLERMNQIRSIDIANDSITVEAGCILETVQKTANLNERRFGLSIASQGSCLIGGNLATNAGGIQVLRYGNARDMCLGLEAVMADGSILNDLNPLRKDNTGYDLRHLLIGSEGTLGIITAAALKLSPQPDEAATVMAAVHSPGGALSLLHIIRNHMGDTVTAFELMSRLGVDLATRHFDELRDPFDTPHQWYVVMEIEGSADTRSKLETILQMAFDQEILRDAVLAQSDQQSRLLWRLREHAYEYNTREGAICSSDTAVPLSRIQDFVDTVLANIGDLDPRLRVNIYGHVGDGNIHVNVFGPDGSSKPSFLATHPDLQQSLRMIINEVTRDCQGSISAEHGIGRLKKSDLQIFADPTKLAIMLQIKQALDPDGILNPGALL